MSSSTWGAGVPLPLLPLLHDAETSEGLGRWRIAREQYEQALRESPVTSPGAISARIVRRIARCLVEEGELCAAMDSLELARNIAEGAGDTAGIAHAINLEGIIAQQRGELGFAEERYRAARSIAWEARDTLLIAMLDQNLGTVANIRGDVVEAKLRYEASLAAYRVLNVRRPIGPLHNNLGMLHTDLQQWREAERHFTSALVEAAGCGDVGGHLRVEVNRAEMYVARRRFRKARKLCRRVMTLVRRHADCDGIWLAEAYKHLGVTHRETGRLEDAETCFTRSLELAEHREDALLTAETLRELAALYQLSARHRETLVTLTRAHAIFEKLSARTDLTDVSRKLEHLEEQFVVIVRRWGESIESADSYTQGHSQRVADLACLLAKDLGFDDRTLLWFGMGALLHDVGKLLVPTDVLNKRGALTPDETQLMRMHPAAGEALVRDADFPWDIRPMIRHHHERWDGTGYPDGLAGTNIPVTARILCIADVYDALTSARSYREAYAPHVAVAIMESESGRAFDPDLLRTFLDVTLPRLRRRNSVQVTLESFRLPRDRSYLELTA